MKFLQLIILSLTLTSVIILSTGLYFAFDYPWYQKEFSRLNVYQKIEPGQVASQTFNIFSYLQDKERLTENHYTDREKIHLTDVKNLINWAKVIDLLLIFCLIAQFWWLVKKKWKKYCLIENLFFASLISLVIYLLLIALLYLAFSQIFLGFHQLFFNNNYWQLDPNIESLIVIFPPELFFALVNRITVFSLITALLLLISSGSVLLINKK